jgi:predicted transcriptional regulator
MEKMTNVRAIDFVLTNCEIPADVAEKLGKMREQFVKKSTGERKPTATQTENADFKNDILNGMEPGTLYTITDLIKAIPSIADLSNQRVSALVRQLVESGAVIRTEEKRKAYFSLAEIGEDEGEDE